MKTLFISSFIILLTSCSKPSEKAAGFINTPTQKIEQKVDESNSEENGENLPSEDLDLLQKLEINLEGELPLNVSDELGFSVWGTYSKSGKKKISGAQCSCALGTLSNDTLVAQSEGDTSLTCNFEGQTSEVYIKIINDTLTLISAENNQLKLPIQTKRAIKIFAHYASGIKKDITKQASYSVMAPIIGEITANQEIHGFTAGNSTIQVEYKGLQTSINFEVQDITISSIEFASPVEFLTVGQNKELKVFALTDQGQKIDITNSANIQVNNVATDVASLSSENIFSLHQAQTIQLDASFHTHTAQKTIYPLADSITALSIQGPNSLNLNTAARYKVIGTLSSGQEMDLTQSCEFTLSSGLQNLGEGLIKALSLGSSSLEARFQQLSQTINIEVESKTLDHLSLSSEQILIAHNINPRFELIAHYTDGSTQVIEQGVSWTSSNESLLVHHAEGLFHNLSSSSSTEEMSVSAHYEGQSLSANVIISPATIESLLITPTDVKTSPMKTQQLKAYGKFNDGANLDLTSLVSWSTSDPNIAIVSSSLETAGQLWTLNEGQVTILASIAGVTSQEVIIDIQEGQDNQITTQGIGLLATYFNGRNFDEAKGQRIDASIDFNWDRGQAPLGVGDRFSVRWEGYILLNEANTCRFGARSDDGFRMFADTLNDEQNLVEVFNDWSLHAPRTRYSDTDVLFEAGVKKRIRVEFFENTGHSVAELLYRCEEHADFVKVPTHILHPLK